MKRHIKVAFSFFTVFFLIFASLPISYALTGTTVGTSTSNTATLYNSQQKSFYYGGYFWVFYWNGTNWVYRTSSDGNTWSSATAFSTRIYGRGYADFKLDSSSGEVYYGVGHYDGRYYLIYFNKGTISGSSITWGTEVQVYSSTSYIVGVSVAKDTDGKYWIAFHTYDSSYLRAYYSTDGSTWTSTTAGTLTPSSTTGGVAIVPMLNGKMMIFVKDSGNILRYNIWSGSAWGSLTSLGVTLASGWGAFSAVSNGDIVHLVYLKSTGDICYRKYSGSWSSETVLQSSATSTSFPVINIDLNTNNLYVFWSGYPTANHIYYRKYNGTAWETAVDWIDESAEVLTGNDRLTCFHQVGGNAIGLVYMTGTTTYNVKFAYLSLAAWHDVENWFVNLWTMAWRNVEEWSVQFIVLVCHTIEEWFVNFWTLEAIYIPTPTIKWGMIFTLAVVFGIVFALIFEEGKKK